MSLHNLDLKMFQNGLKDPKQLPSCSSQYHKEAKSLVLSNYLSLKLISFFFCI